MNTHLRNFALLAFAATFACTADPVEVTPRSTGGTTAAGTTIETDGVADTLVTDSEPQPADDCPAPIEAEPAAVSGIVPDPFKLLHPFTLCEQASGPKLTVTFSPGVYPPMESWSMKITAPSSEENATYCLRDKFLGMGFAPGK